LVTTHSWSRTDPSPQPSRLRQDGVLTSPDPRRILPRRTQPRSSLARLATGVVTTPRSPRAPTAGLPPRPIKPRPSPLHSLTPLLPHPRHRAENTPKPPWLLLAGGSSTTVTTMEVASRSGSHPTFLSLPLYSLMLTDLLPS
jgi:hypothetical protein